MKMILLRHGETEENAAHCYLGHYDAPLNETGRSQIRSLSKRLKLVAPRNNTFLYSSDLSRAMESAQIIGKELQLTPSVPVFAWRELNFGEWECKTYDTIFSQDQERVEKWICDPFRLAPPNGETLQQLGKRIDDWLVRLLEKGNRDETIIIVTHGGPIRWFLSKWIKGDINEFWKVTGSGHGEGISAEFNEQTGKFTFLNKL